MNDRGRRIHQTRRHVQGQSVLNLGRTMTNNGRPIDTYSSSNYRHPSTTTTTTTTDPSSTTSSQDDTCGISVCYSYLIAITSSFLVVLGIYLSLTRFNIRFLSISLLGILIEAFGACIYCVNNIRANRLSRHKHRIDSDDFILSNGLGFDCTTPTSASLNINNNHNAHQIAPVPHLLNNHTVTPSATNGPTVNSGIETNLSAITDSTSPPQLTRDIIDSTGNLPHADENLGVPNTGVEPVPNEDHQPIRNISEDSIGTNDAQTSEDQLPKNYTSNQTSQDTSRDTNHVPGTSLLETSKLVTTSPGSASSRVHINSEHDDESNRTDQTDSLPVEIPRNLSSNLIDQLGITLSSDVMNKDKNHNDTQPMPSAPSDINVRQVTDESNLISITVQSLPSTSRAVASPVSSSEVKDVTEVKPSKSEVATSSQTHPLIQSEPITDTRQDNRSINRGLVTSGSMDATNAPPKRNSDQARQRAINLRRTLVMGLSGEEELIEINEEDLDNMSILPPSYESIVTTNQVNND